MRKIISIFKQSVNFVNFGELEGADILHYFGIVISMRCQLLSECVTKPAVIDMRKSIRARVCVCVFFFFGGGGGSL